MFREDFLDEIKKKWNEKYMDFVKQHVKVGEEIETLKELKHKIAEKVLNGTFSDEFGKEQIAKVDLEIMTIKTVQHEGKLTQLDIEIVVKFMDGFLENIAKAFIEARSLEQKQELVCSIFPNGVVFRNGKVEHLGLVDWMLCSQSADSIKTLSGR